MKLVNALMLLGILTMFTACTTTKDRNVAASEENPSQARFLEWQNKTSDSNR